MAIIKPLSDTAIKSAKFDPDTPAANVMRDGQGLELRISKTAKSWVFKYQRPGSPKRSNIGFGKYPEITLKEAREKRQEARALLAQGIDPGIAKKLDKAEAATVASNTFKALAEHHLELLATTCTPAHVAGVRSRLETYVYPALGTLPASEIRAPYVIAALQPLADAGHLDTLKRCCQVIKVIMDRAVNRGLVQHNVCAAIGSEFAKPVTVHMATLPNEGIVELMQKLDAAGMDLPTRWAIELQLHTMTRPAEACGARWAEFDLDQRLWTIPGARMKKKRDHVVPLSDEVIELLGKAAMLSAGREHVFPGKGNPTKPINSGTPCKTLARIGLSSKQDAHGLRALASTTLNDGGFDPDVIEVALAHAVGSKTARAYNRAKYLPARIELMREWSAHITRARQGIYEPPKVATPDNVVELRALAG